MVGDPRFTCRGPSLRQLRTALHLESYFSFFPCSSYGSQIKTVGVYYHYEAQRQPVTHDGAVVVRFLSSRTLT